MRLTEPLQIKNLTLRNRIVLPPMKTGKSESGGPSAEMIDYYAARGESTGLLILEHEYISPEGQASASQLSMADDSLIPAYQRFTAEVHKRGAAIIAQINHAGAAAMDTGLPLLGPSRVSCRADGQMPLEMQDADIKKVIRDFTAAALRVQQAGFDGVEIHAAHGYLLNQFYSPATNHRRDSYSGLTLEGRTRLQIEVIRSVRAVVGPDFLIALRFGAFDGPENGSRKEEIPAAARLFEDAGIDLLDISGGLSGYNVKGCSTPGWFADLSTAARRAVTIPVILTGGIRQAADAERLLAEGAADLIGVGRAMMQNAHWSKDAITLLRGQIAENS